VAPAAAAAALQVLRAQPQERTGMRPSARSTAAQAGAVEASAPGTSAPQGSRSHALSLQLRAQAAPCVRARLAKEAVACCGARARSLQAPQPRRTSCWVCRGRACQGRARRACAFGPTVRFEVSQLSMKASCLHGAARTLAVLGCIFHDHQVLHNDPSKEAKRTNEQLHIVWTVVVNWNGHGPVMSCCAKDTSQFV